MVTRWRAVVFASAALLVASIVGSAHALAMEVRLLSTNAVTDVVTSLLPQFESRTSIKVSVVFEPTAAILDRLKAGEAADVVILIRQAVDDLAAAGKVVQGSEMDVARTSLALAVRAGSSKPDISTIEGLKSALLNANAIAISEVGASGTQFVRILDKLGIADAVTPKLKRLRGAARTAQLVADGEADIAVQMRSELQGVAGAEVIGPLPGELRFEILVTAALNAGTKQPQAGTALINFLASTEAAASLQGKGMEPPRPR